jgi:hypothetical protein
MGEAHGRKPVHRRTFMAAVAISAAATAMLTAAAAAIPSAWPDAPHSNDILC